jgi:hypothetical protein
MGPRGFETEDSSKFSAVGTDLCEDINFVTADDWWKDFEHLKSEGVLSERGALVGGITGDLVLQITADSDDIVQYHEVQTDCWEEGEILFLACCNGKQQ